MMRSQLLIPPSYYCMPVKSQTSLRQEAMVGCPCLLSLCCKPRSRLPFHRGTELMQLGVRVQVHCF